MLQVIAEVEQRLELLRAQDLGDVLVGLEQRQELALAAPDPHRVALDDRVGVVTRNPLLGQRQQDALRMDEAAEPVEVLPHRLRIDHQLVDHARKPRQRKVERDRRVGGDHALDRGMRDVALMPERHVLERRRHRRAHHPGEPGEVLGQDRIALVRHRGRALLPFGEEFLRFHDFGALQMPDLGRQPLDRRCDDAERGKERRVAIARDDLGRNRLRLQAQFRRYIRLDPWIDIGEGADRPGNRAGRNLLARRDKPGAGAGELGMGDGELEAEGGGLGVDSVRAADRRRHLMLEGAALQRREQRVDVGDEDVARTPELHGEAGVEHVRACEAQMDEARVGADEFGEMGEEGDHVMLGHLLDLIDPSRRRTWPVAPFSQIAFAAAFGITPISAIASEA